MLSRRSVTYLLALAAVLFQLACESPLPVSAPPPADAAIETTAVRDTTSDRSVKDRYDLEHDEARGGHTLARHVGRSDDDLRERLRKEPQISAASTYSDRATAERVVALTLARHQARLDQWLGRLGPRPNLALDYRSPGGDMIGRSLSRRSRQSVACSDAVVVLRSDGGRGFYVLTSYPELSR